MAPYRTGRVSVLAEGGVDGESLLGQRETPEQRKGRDRTMGIKETSEAGAEGWWGETRRGKLAEEAAETRPRGLEPWRLCGKPTVTSREETGPQCPPKAMPSPPDRQFRPFVLGLP